MDGGPAQALTPPLTLSPAGGSTLTLGRAYRGRLSVDVVNGKLRAINVLPLEQYLYGVVPAEMPSAWLPAALEAQAVAARSYALAGRRAGAPFDVSSSGQSYLGVSVETPAATQAVDVTAGEVLLYNGNVADTLFSSSSGGRSQSAVDAFGSPGRPYLVSVDDPYDTISPYHDWGPVAVTGKTLGKALGVTGRVTDATRQAQRVAPREDRRDHLARARGPGHHVRGRRGRAVGARRSARRGSASACSRSSRRHRIHPSHPARGSS